MVHQLGQRLLLWLLHWCKSLSLLNASSYFWPGLRFFSGLFLLFFSVSRFGSVPWVGACHPSGFKRGCYTDIKRSMCLKKACRLLFKHKGFQPWAKPILSDPIARDFLCSNVFNESLARGLGALTCTDVSLSPYLLPRGLIKTKAKCSWQIVVGHTCLLFLLPWNTTKMVLVAINLHRCKCDLLLPSLTVWKVLLFAVQLCVMGYGYFFSPGEENAHKKYALVSWFMGLVKFAERTFG